MQVPNYPQAAYDLVPTIRAQITGHEDEGRALAIIQANMPSMGSANDVRDGLLKMAGDFVANPVSKADPKAYVEGCDAQSLVDALGIAIMGAQWGASLDSTSRFREQGR